jgi:adenine-specific DNA-methyltransferase
MDAFGVWKRAEGFLAEKAISEIVDYGNIPVLEGITVPMSIVTVSNTHADGTTNAVILDDPRIDDISLFSVTHRNGVKLPGEDKWIFTEDKSTALISKIKNSGIPLKKYTEGAIFRGILTGLNEAFVISSEQAKEIINSFPKCSEILKPFLSGRNVKRYATPLVKKYLICMPKGFTGSRYIGPAPWDWLEQTYQPVAEHLKPFEAKASSRRDKGDFWWELRSFRHYDKISQAKIICPVIVNKISAIMDTNGTFSNDKTSVIAVEIIISLGS